MRSTRTAIGAAIALVVAMPPVAALAHAGLASSSPAAGVTLTTPPAAVTLVFDDELQPDGTGFTVTDPDGVAIGEGELDLAVAGRNEVSGGVEIDSPGTYTVTWTAVAADGHQEEGEFVFSVATAAEAPNTAAIPPGPEVPATLGSILLVVAVGIGLRRAWRAAS